MQYWHQGRQINQGNRIEFRSRPTHVWSIDFDKGIKTTQLKRLFFKQMIMEQLDIYLQQQEQKLKTKNLNPDLISYTKKINTIWIIDLNVKLYNWKST